MRIVSSRVKAIKRWPWLMGWFESLIKSLIEPNAPMVLRPMCFHLIYQQLLDEHIIAINSLNLCPFPEPNSRVLELYAHSFSSSILQSVDSSQEKKFLGHPIRTPHPMSLSCNLLQYLWISELLHPHSVLQSSALCWEYSSSVRSFFNPSSTLLTSSHGGFWVEILFGFRSRRQPDAVELHLVTQRGSCR